jgi:hypothetical protein
VAQLDADDRQRVGVGGVEPLQHPVDVIEIHAMTLDARPPEPARRRPRIPIFARLTSTSASASARETWGSSAAAAHASNGLPVAKARRKRA